MTIESPKQMNSNYPETDETLKKLLMIITTYWEDWNFLQENNTSRLRLLRLKTRLEAITAHTK